MQIGLYIHIPFCASKCHYCDFLSFANSTLQETYCSALIKEIQHYAESINPSHTVQSIFIGGGTPTMLPPVLLDKICLALTEQFHLAKNAEWTIEANPGTITKETVKVINSYPVNRISLGLQSTHNRLLKLLGRIHSFEDWEKNFYLLKEHTACSINSDIMFALPTQTMQEFEETLFKLEKYPLDHLSLYAMILEEGTRFWNLYQNKQLELIDEVTDRKMYHYAKYYLKEIGYEQYEISNWAKPQKACRHNLLYWERGDYIGMGLGAHSLLNDTRYHNESNLEKYVAAQGELDHLKQDEEFITQEMAMQEFMFLGLRKTAGISLKAFYSAFQKDVFDVYKVQLNKWIKHKILVKNNDSLYLSDYGMDVCNEVFSSFL